ncbi:MAG: CoA-binding protein [Nitrospirae bacterium]|nr:CoA-binding protein [Candidatus Manganitrophaceae bacterium]
MDDKKVAIVGASHDRRKFGNKAVRAFLEKGFRVFPVHPSETEVEGLRVYHSVLEIPEEVRTASFYVPPDVGLQIIEEVASKAGMKIVYLNPGADGEKLIRRGSDLGLEIRVACSILAIGADPRRY